MEGEDGIREQGDAGDAVAAGSSRRANRDRLSGSGLRLRTSSGAARTEAGASRPDRRARDDAFFVEMTLLQSAALVLVLLLAHLAGASVLLFVSSEVCNYDVRPRRRTVGHLQEGRVNHHTGDLTWSA